MQIWEYGERGKGEDCLHLKVYEKPLERQGIILKINPSTTFDIPWNTC